MRLAHIDLTDNSLSAVGGGMDLGDTSSTGDVGLVTSGSAARGLMGLVALVSEDVGAMLVVPPRLNGTFRATSFA